MLSPRQRGFTLIEILIVLVLIAVMAGLVTATLGANPHNALNREARRLQAVLQMAADEAVFQGLQWSMALPEQGYQFLVFNSEDFSWSRVESAPFNLHTLNSAVTLRLTIEGEQLDPQALEQMQRMTSLKSDQALQPVLLLLSSGEVMPFSIMLTHVDLDGGIQLRSDGVTPIELLDRVEN
ncbi:MAG: type II secretion system minor pseudopilin GspH [Spongiibacteraceae bacterium]|nr:type II secretion system minor pseudopilin GspH [Spongiibacteraceae bacterium]